MIKISVCHTCGKVLAECETVWACGLLFCSHECGVKWAMTKYEDWEYDGQDDLVGKATAYFNDVAEEVDLETIGIEKEVWTAYASDADITTVLETTSEGGEPLYTEVISWYFGTPDKEDTEYYAEHRNLRATLFRCEDLEA